MNFKFLGKTKTMGILLLSAVAVSSGTMAFAANGADVVHKNVLVSAAPVSADESKADFAKKIASNSGTIEYVKITHTNMQKDNGDISFELEKWYNLKTNESRNDAKDISGNSFTNYKSIYMKNNNEDFIVMQRDQKGNAISGTIEYASKQPFGIKYAKHMSFAELKNFYLSADWKAEGTEKASDGTELKKVSQSYMSANFKDQQVNTKNLIYLDEVTGLPVKEEVYQEDNGSMKMIWSETFEYKYVNDDGKLFDTTGVKLQEVFQHTK
jgi:hypothetical protein